MQRNSSVSCVIGLFLLCVTLLEAKKHHHHKKHGHHHHHGHHNDRHRPQSLCSAGWSEHGDSCYRVLAEAETWHDGALRCRANEAHLVVMNSFRKAAWLKQLLHSTQRGCSAWWTSGYSTDRCWFWQPLDSIYEVQVRSGMWYGGEPPAAQHDNEAISFQLSRGFFGLIARPANTLLPIICEKDVDREDTRGESSRGRGHHHGHHRGHSHSHESHESRGGHRGHHSRGHSRSRSHSHSHSQEESYVAEDSQVYLTYFTINPYVHFFPRPELPYWCPQPRTTPAPTTTESTTVRSSSIVTTPRPTSTQHLTTSYPVTSTTDPALPCPSGWYHEGTNCYKVYTDCALPYEPAKAKCEDHGGSLILLNTQGEEDFIFSKLDKRSTYWISDDYEHDDDDDSSSSGDIDDDYLLVIDTKSGSKDRVNTHYVLNWTNTFWDWNEVSMQTFNSFICEVPQGKVKPAEESDSWRRYMAYEYLIHDQCSKTRSQAASLCREKDSLLVSITSSAEMRYLERSLRLRTYDQQDAPLWWTGGRKVGRRWEWQGSRRSMIYTNWGPTADNEGNFLALKYFPYHDKWMWQGAKPRNKLPFICKRAAKY